MPNITKGKKVEKLPFLLQISPTGLGCGRLAIFACAHNATFSTNQPAVQRSRVPVGAMQCSSHTCLSPRIVPLDLKGPNPGGHPGTDKGAAWSEDAGGTKYLSGCGARGACAPGVLGGSHSIRKAGAQPGGGGGMWVQASSGERRVCPQRGRYEKAGPGDTVQAVFQTWQSWRGPPTPTPRSCWCLSPTLG